MILVDRFWRGDAEQDKMITGNITIHIEDSDKKVARPSNALWNTSAPQEIAELAAFTKGKLIEIALMTLHEEQLKGFDRKPLTLVDGIENYDLDDVKPFGQIQFISRVAAEDFLLPIYQGLIKRSAYDEGGYSEEGHFVYVNQQLVANSLSTLQSYIKSSVKLFKTGDIIRFVNVMPYAGKLERNGVTATRRGKGNVKEKMSKDKKRGYRSGFTVRAPNGAYFLTAKSINKNYKFVSKIEFQWVNGANIDLTAAPTHSKIGKKFRRTFAPKKGRGARKGSYAYPSIVVIINEGGLK